MVGRRRWRRAASTLRSCRALPKGSEAVGSLRDEIADRFGLPRATVVAAGGGDAAVGAIGIGAVRPGAAFVSLGTAAQLIVASDAYRAGARAPRP